MIGYELNPLDLLLDQCQVLVRNMVATFISTVLLARHAMRNSIFEISAEIIKNYLDPKNHEHGNKLNMHILPSL